MREQQSEMLELDSLKQQLQATSQQSAEWQNKLSCAVD
jgi:hypothetical protein